MPELVARHFDAGSSERVSVSPGLTTVVCGLLLLLTVSCAFCLERFWRSRRAWRLARERDEMERVQLHDEMYGNDDDHCLSAKEAAPASKTPLDSALRKVSQLVPIIR